MEGRAATRPGRRLALTACAIVTAALTSCTSTADRTADVTAALITPEGLLLHYTGGSCDGAVSTQAGEGRVVTVRVVAEQTGRDCDDVGLFRTVAVPLDQPLGDRGVRDEKDGHRLCVYRGERQLQPGRLPAGYALAREAPVCDGATALGLSRTWATAGPCPSSLTVTQAAGQALPSFRRSAWAPAGRLEVAGEPVRVWRTWSGGQESVAFERVLAGRPVVVTVSSATGCAQGRLPERAFLERLVGGLA
ncbi:hypothetical protein [Motilibacter aurantiacus]|uniref:hypothetical protein n=1 Tax=Motilibacter aurantiacus TaxID=2714955 RepID=UPI00140AE50D|nr:hypothetical protein [Motilibacter aurantiacus]NHC45690.1 hypothetical protein [Motilibacter aurantiacus]